MKKIVVILILVFTINYVSAQKEDSIKLLALAESGNISRGAVADLILEIQPGKERVFLDTFPLTKTTTQVSMRYAQQIACDQLEIDCTKLDFFYTIRAPRGIVGGPSAGAAASVLTGAMLKNLPIKKDIAITGTIQSGGLIGSVGGLTHKIKAASEAGIKRVLIPKGTRKFKEENKTTDLIELGNNFSISVKEIATFEEALAELTDYKTQEGKDEIIVQESYNKIMKEISEEICNRTVESITGFAINTSLQAKNFSELRKIEKEKGKYYSAASLCFRSNLAAKQEAFNSQNITKEQIELLLSSLIKKINKFEAEIINKSLASITDVQTLMAVQERILDSKDAVITALENINDTKKSVQFFAYADERFFSAQTWSKFFDTSRNKVNLDEKKLRNSCENKISEAEESYNSLTQYIPDVLEKQRKELFVAYASLANQSYVQCLYQAAKSKAEINSLLGLIGSDDNSINEQLDTKINIAKKAIIKAQKKNIFPLLSYAYYEYADSLRSIDKGSASLFAEYALEFSNLDIYFDGAQKLKKPNIFANSYSGYIEFFTIGAVSGVLSALLLFMIIKTLQTPPKKRLRGKKR